MTNIKHQKPKAFYKEFTRKGEGEKNTHYCPGCGHGTVHKLIAEATDDLNLNDRVIFCSPVGCSVFAYYYFDYGNIECAHGRAPAVATGIRRTLEDAVIISYQGDGDLAAIGMGAIIHAANRGENITVFFVNNAIYGMTGGQMAPTTILGQKTLTTPIGRTQENDGKPIGMAELINALDAPVYVERVSLATPAKVMKARKAIRKALKIQVEKKGFSFVEILSTCPINWKMSPLESRKWLIDNLEPVFPVQQFRDRSDEAEKASNEIIPKLTDNELLGLFQTETKQLSRSKKKSIEKQEIKIAGFGGQGVLSAGVLLANCALIEKLKTTWIPSYGAEMRGGTAYASVIISPDTIGSPIVTNPNVLFSMNYPSLEAFEKTVQPNGLILVNSSLVDVKVKRKDVRTVYVPASEMANELGQIAVANIIMVSVYLHLTGVMDMETLKYVIPLSLKKKKVLAINMKAVDAGLRFAREQYPEGMQVGNKK